MTPRDSISRITAEVVNCRKCPRLVEWREEAARNPPARFQAERYWARPLPGFGNPRGRVLVVGLAPAAHGGNRTGRIFTGDRSGDWLFRALYRAGFANQPDSVNRNDGLRLSDCYVAAAVRCAPPSNKPTVDERDNCLPYLQRELTVLRNVEVIVALGSFAWDCSLKVLKKSGVQPVGPRPRFTHLAESRVGRFLLIGSYHPSQQNTFTGTLTEEDFDAVFERVRKEI